MNSYFYIFLSIILAVVSQLIVKWKMSLHSLDHEVSVIGKFMFAFSMLLDPYIIASIVLTLISGLAWMIAMTKVDISYAYPFTILGFVLVLLFSAILFNEAITWQKVIGLGFIFLGILISSRSL